MKGRIYRVVAMGVTLHVMLLPFMIAEILMTCWPNCMMQCHLNFDKVPSFLPYLCLHMDILLSAELYTLYTHTWQLEVT